MWLNCLQYSIICMVATRCSFRPFVPYLERAAVGSMYLKFNQDSSKAVRQVFLQLTETLKRGQKGKANTS